MPALLDRVAAFLFREARLLDARDWPAWLDLFAPEGMYWVPLEHGQTDPIGHASLFYEDALMREVRARRLEEKRAWSQQPVTQAARIVGNVVLLPAPEGEIVVGSTFHMLEWRRSAHRMLGGQYTHRLRPAGEEFRILLKRVDLIDCDAPQDILETFI
jgi:benzoate/toluate 1,2-dioxygenase beta subunit